MLRTIYFGIAAILISLLLPASALAKPSPPETQLSMGGFQGTVLAGGNVIGSGMSVSAWIEEEKVAETQTEDDSTYILFITGDYNGKTVSFKVGSHNASQTATWENEKVKTLDLSINIWPYECIFFGEATVDGQHVPDGTEISAWIDYAKVHSTTTVGSLYHLVVPGNYTGKSVCFKVDTDYAGQIASWERGAEIETNLTISLGPLVCGFYGPVTLDGASVPDGTRVSAWIDSQQLTSTITTDGKFGLNIPGNYTGKIVSFKVNDQPVKEIAMWSRGQNVQATLAAITTGTPRVILALSSTEIRAGDEFTISIGIDPNGHGITGGEINLYSVGTKVMSILLEQLEIGNLLGPDPAEGLKEITDTGNGEILRYAIARKGEPVVPTAPGTLATIGLRIKGGAPAGKYAIPNAVSLTDEYFESVQLEPSTISITVLAGVTGDINGDESVGLVDLAILASVYGAAVGETAFRADADLNSNNEIDIGDLAILGSSWGQQRI